MKDKYIVDINSGEEITSFFILKSIAVKIGSNKKQYLDLLLGDKTGEISGKKWDLMAEEIDGARVFTEGEVLKIKGQVTEWNGMKQLKVSKIRKTGPEDNIDLVDYIKAAPEPPEDMYNFIWEAAARFDDEELKALCQRNLEENKEKLLYYPAAAKNHHAELAGLLWHVKRMIMSGESLCQIYTNLNKDLVITGVILHDMQKINEINSNTMGISDGYFFEGMMLGHIVQGIKVLDRHMEELGFSKEKAVMVEHMILSHHYEPEFGSPKKPLFPEAELLHYLDMIDARMYDMASAIENTKPGEFSDRVWTLDNRRIYRLED